MGKIKKIKRVQGLGVLLMIVVIVIIFIFSNQPAQISYSISDTFASNTNTWHSPLFSIRKWAHILLFSILGLSAMMTFDKAILATIFCYFYACIDEVHQMLIPGRSALFEDTLIDALGFGIAIILFQFVKLLYKKRINKSEIGVNEQ